MLMMLGWLARCMSDGVFARILRQMLKIVQILQRPGAQRQEAGQQEDGCCAFHEMIPDRSEQAFHAAGSRAESSEHRRWMLHRDMGLRPMRESPARARGPCHVNVSSQSAAQAANARARRPRHHLPSRGLPHIATRFVATGVLYAFIAGTSPARNAMTTTSARYPHSSAPTLIQLIRSPIVE